MKGTAAPVRDRNPGDRARSERARASALRAADPKGSRPAHPASSGLPPELLAGVESLSGRSLDQVRVHYRSERPAQLGALAYAQGRDIHLAPGQERHLPHEAWHVVQQAQGRVRGTFPLRPGLSANDDARLEHEAEIMGERALCTGRAAGVPGRSRPPSESIAGAWSTLPPSARADEPGASPPATYGVVQRVSFGADTTYGLEVEFTNRWMSLLGWGKELPNLELKPDAIFHGSPALTVGGDDGRMGTVMEIESRVYGQQDWALDQVHREVKAMLDRSNEIVGQCRADPTYAGVVANDRHVVQKLFSQPLPPNCDPLLAQQADVLLQRPDRKDQLPNPPNLAQGVVDPDAIPPEDIVELLETASAGQQEPAKATLQITTLARNDPGHYAALAEVSTQVEEQNRAGIGQYYDIPREVSEEAMAWLNQLRTDLKPDPQADPRLLEDFVVTLECLVKMALFAQRDVGSERYGTIKNMPHVLPRRHVTPPPQGFASALGISPQAYLKEIGAIEAELTGPSQQLDPLAADVLKMLYRGTGPQASEAYTKRAEAWLQSDEAKHEGQVLPYSLWTIEGGVPTLESEIIHQANKPDPDKWTAHELRNFGWAMGMKADELTPYLEIVKQHAK